MLTPETSVRYAEHEGVAVLTIDNPPVNALNAQIATQLGEAMGRAVANDSIRAVVIMGAGRTFVAGGDIAVLQDMAWDRGPGFPRLHDLLLRIEQSPKPVIMAMHGSVLGGGLELAMAGHYRIAAPSTQFGQPEVNLGIIPGAEGTQRLPRLVGLERAIEMIVSGKPIDVEKAMAFGLIDAVIDGDLHDSALSFAQTAQPTVATSMRPIPEAGSVRLPELLEAGRRLAASSRRNESAPQRALEALEAAATSDFEVGCQREWQIFQECIRSNQARSLMHAFFAERTAAKLPDRSAVPRRIQRVGIFGAGTMGSGIAMVFANAGIPVLLRDESSQALQRGTDAIRKNYETSRKRGRFTSEEVEQRLSLIQGQSSLTGFEGCDLLIEAVFEDMAVKMQVFQQMDQVADPGCLLASNTSTLDIDALADITSRPHDVFGLHFFSPASVMRLVEVVQGRMTSPDAIATGMAVAKQLQKVGVLVGNGPGFVGNRLFFPYMWEAQYLVEEGASPKQVDQALVDFGMAMGIFAVDDLAGIDVAWRVRQEFGSFGAPSEPLPILQDRLYALGRYGQKTGRGWYIYGDDRKSNVDPIVTDLIEQSSREAGVVRRSIGDEEIVERCLYTLVNEGARVLESGVARRSSDIDVIYLNGYGFPRWRGGPMCFADCIGLGTVLSTIERLYGEKGERWRPAPLLVHLARQGRSFREYDAAL